MVTRLEKVVSDETVTLLGHLDYENLTARERRIIKPIKDIAIQAINNLHDGPELKMGLRKLIEAKDCFCRAAKGITAS